MLVAIGLLTLFLVTRGGGRHHATHAPPAPSRAATPGAARSPRVALAARRVTRLTAPVQLPATAPLSGGRALLAGGLDQADTSVAAVWRTGPGGTRSAGTLPAAIHDAAAATVHGRSYVFGGGEPSRDGILELRPGGVARQVARLAAPASDLSAAVVGGTVYVVGGYTGSAPLATIAAWRPGQPRARVVARLPQPLRYAAVAARGGSVVIAGGTVGVAASDAVYGFDTATGRVSRLATLPHPLTHAAAAPLGDTVYVFGGRGAAPGSQTDAIFALTPGSRRPRRAGRLPVALSDIGAAPAGGGILVAGGRDAAGTVQDAVWRLAPR
ncbi:MAG: hypothetical protein QOG63_2827 [Thermoleophilaceae bacterium]|nr:hypothetical protein [Thermoleophilaceae bacterium]